jgi:ariadne-1
LFQLSPVKVRALLNKFKWDKEKLLESYYSDSHETPEKQQQQVSEEKAVLSPGIQTCQICLSDTEASEMSALLCGHPFCSEW